MQHINDATVPTLLKILPQR